jgi:nucleotide-binding universal stress UspA family protein
MKIIVPIDGSRHAQRAVDFVAARSSLIGAAPTVWLVNVQPQIVPGGRAVALSYDKLRRYYAEESERVLLPARKRLQRAGLAARTLAVNGTPGPRIARVARAKDADLIVMGSHGRGALANVVLGSVASGVLAHCDTPVLLMRDAPPPQADSLRVGIAVDGSEYGAAAVRYVLKDRSLFGAAPQFALIHVIADLPIQLKTLLPNLADLAFSHERVRALRRQAFERVFKPVRRLLAAADVTAQEVERTGDAGDEIAAYSQRHLDVLVMGSHGRGRFTSAVLGSVAMHVAARCTTPLLLVRHA